MNEWFGDVNLAHIVDYVESDSGEITLRANKASFRCGKVNEDDKSVFFPSFRIPALPGDTLLIVRQDCGEIEIREEPVLAWCAPQEWTEPSVPFCIRGIYPLRSDKNTQIFFTRDGARFWDLCGEAGPFTREEAIGEGIRNLKPAKQASSS